MRENFASRDCKQQLVRLSDPVEQRKLQSDAELLGLYLDAGDTQAMECLIRRHAPMVASVCRLTVSNAASAEDAFQATFLILLKSAAKIRKHASLAAWLHGVAYRTACRIREQAKARKQRSGQDQQDATIFEQHADPSVDEPIVMLARKMDLEALDRELENLPSRIREPMIEHYLLGLSAPEIAERMELSLSAVEGRLKRGRRQLRSLLVRRGISLSVLSAASGFFQQYVRASDATDWTAQLLDSSMPAEILHGGEVTSSPNHVSSLVQGELNMFGLTQLTMGLAAAGLLIAGTLGVLASGPPQTGRGQQAAFKNSNAERVSDNFFSKPKALNLPAVTEPEVTLAQFGTPDAQSGSGDPKAQQTNKATPRVTTGSGMHGYGAGMGGMGGGGMGGMGGGPGGGGMGAYGAGGMGGMGGYGGMGMSGGSNTTWQRPDGEAEETPIWLAGGAAHMKRIEENRAALAKSIEFNVSGMPLANVATVLSEKAGVQIVLNRTELDLLGIDPDIPITLDSASSTVRELLRRVTSPLELSYVVYESAIEITSKDDAESHLAMRFYDLSYILPNASSATALINGIEQTIHPDSWLVNGGTSSIVLVGSMMVVAAPESTHQMIEIFLINVARMNPTNAK